MLQGHAGATSSRARSGCCSARFAIVLGVAFVAGTLIFTNAMGGAFDEHHRGLHRRRRGRLRGRQRLRLLPGQPDAAGLAGDRARGSCPRSTRPTRTTTLAVRLRDRQRRQGRRRQRAARARLQLHRRRATSPATRSFTLVDGRAPRGRRARSRSTSTTAERGGLRRRRHRQAGHPGRPAGDERRARRHRRLRAGGLNGATLTLFDQHRAMQELFFGGQDVYSSISLTAARRRLARTQLRDAAQEVLPAGVVARTGDDVVEDEQEGARRGPRLHHHLPAGLRRRLPGRRHLPDHQHLLDPGRPAQPRAGAAAGAGCVPPPGQPLGARSRRWRSG